ncbi:DMT family transporter [Actinophytocola sediminis]
MAYVYLLLAIAFEVAATSLLKSTDGFSRLWPTVACLAGYAGSFAWLSLAVRQVPIGVAYALWSGIGTTVIVAIGVVFLHESINLTKIVGVLLVVGGVVTLNLGGATQ